MSEETQCSSKISWNLCYEEKLWKAFFDKKRKKMKQMNDKQQCQIYPKDFSFVWMTVVSLESAFLFKK